MSLLPLKKECYYIAWRLIELDDAIMIISTNRLILRPHNETDLAFMIELNADPEVNQFTGDGKIDENEAKQILEAMCLQIERYETSRLIVELKLTGERIGWAGLKYLDQNTADLGYRFKKAYWGQGYATEAAEACMQIAAQLNFKEVVSEVHKNNISSIKILKKLGFDLYNQNDDTEYWHKAIT